ncbi:MAG: polyphosphate kinase 2 family protein [Chloroflexi bacterium]|nr:MAG: polyphosphate kinase 2 family protein [Chloroflexota bacterium]
MAGKTRGRGGLRDRLLVKPGSTVNLADVDPNETFGHVKVTAEVKVAADLERLTSLQERLWAEHRHRVLIVLQGIDASGKDGTITHVMRAFNPLGCRVVGFGVPNPVELAHDYLWRVHQVVPGNGEISVFNRSHYEAVLVERVHSLVPQEVWSRRYDQINAFEQMLVEEGTTILKFFLHIDRDEQKRRLQARVSNPTKRWKFKMGDLAERKLWADYMAAFNEALMRCSTEQAPWFVIPANHNWFRNLAVGDIAAASLDALDPKYPPGEQIPKDLKIE